MKSKTPGGPRERFCEDHETGCWVWSGTKIPSGYGRVKRSHIISAHRLFYSWAYGPIPDGLVIDHMCKNRLCVNPDHLRAVDCRTNVIDNSASIQAENSRKTHCLRGHEFSGDNLRVYTLKSGHKQRFCVACSKIISRRTYLRKTENQADELNVLPTKD
jgi:hypothetical protein